MKIEGFKIEDFKKGTLIFFQGPPGFQKTTVALYRVLRTKGKKIYTFGLNDLANHAKDSHFLLSTFNDTDFYHSERIGDFIISLSTL